MFFAAPADGVAIKLPGAEPFRLCRELLDGVTLVDNSAISTAIKAWRGDREHGLPGLGFNAEGHIPCWHLPHATERAAGWRFPPAAERAACWRFPPAAERAACWLCPARQDVFNETRTILEPAGAVAVAGAKAFLQVGPSWLPPLLLNRLPVIACRLL